jgi:hypothetical protein
VTPVRVANAIVIAAVTVTTLAACGSVETDIWDSASAVPPVPISHPWVAAVASTEVAAQPHGDVLPTPWGQVTAVLGPAAPETTVHSLLSPLATCCDASGGRFHFAHVACHCSGNALYRAGVGCSTAPTLQLATAGCTPGTMGASAHCLRDLHAGPLAWHLQYSGQKALQATVRQALVSDAWPGLLAGGTLLPSAGSPVSLHRTNRLTAGAGKFIGQNGDAVVMWPAQYTEPWTATPAAPPVDWPRTLAGIAGLPQADAATLAAALTQATAALAKAASADSIATAWPEGSVTARSASAAASRVWPAGRMDVAEHHLTTPDNGNLQPWRWQVYLRDGGVIARQLTGGFGAASPTDWQVAALYDAFGNVQALRVTPADANLAPSIVSLHRATPAKPRAERHRRRHAIQ